MTESTTTVITTSLPTAPKSIDLNFDLAALSETITKATGNVTADRNLAEACKRLRRALLNDESYDGVDKSKHSIYSPHGTLATAKEFLSFWESGLISVETRRDPDQRNLGGVEVLQFGRNNSGQSFNIAHSFDHVMGAEVFAAIRLALDYHWTGETEPILANRLRADRERLEILRESLPSAETLSTVESHVQAIYQSLSTRIGTVKAPLAESLASPLDYTAPLDFAFLSSIDGISAELGDARGIARRWMLNIDDGGIAASLASMRDRMSDTAKQLQARAAEIETQRSRLGK